MSGAARGAERPFGQRLNWAYVSAAIVAAVVLALVGANAHLVYVAFASQPDCVTHIKSAGDAGQAFRAAKSAC